MAKADIAALLALGAAFFIAIGNGGTERIEPVGFVPPVRDPITIAVHPVFKELGIGQGSPVDEPSGVCPIVFPVVRNGKVFHMHTAIIKEEQKHRRTSAAHRGRMSQPGSKHNRRRAEN